MSQLRPDAWKEVAVAEEEGRREEEGPGEEPVVIEDSEAEQERKRELDERLQEQGGVEPEEPEPPRTRGGGSPATLVAEARKHVGYRESGNNDTKFNRWLGAIGGYPHGGFGYPWCHAFVSYCLWHSGNDGAGPRTASCAQGVAWFKGRNRWSSAPQVGDLVYYGAGGGTHVELVSGVSAGKITTIGGNTGGSMGGNYFNGDGVYEKTVDRTSSRIYGYGRPTFTAGAAPGTATKPITTVRTIRQQQEAVNRLGYAPPLDVDNEWGPKTEAGVKWLQKKIGAGADGQWGQETERKLAAFAK